MVSPNALQSFGMAIRTFSCEEKGSLFTHLFQKESGGVSFHKILNIFFY